MATATIETLPHAKLRSSPLRRVALCSAAEDLRASLGAELRSLRWTVSEVASGAQLFALLDQEPIPSVLIDSWLPDFAVEECMQELRESFPELDILALDGSSLGIAAGAGALPAPLRQELLYALRQAETRSTSSAGLPADDADPIRAGARGAAGASAVMIASARVASAEGPAAVHVSMPESMPEFLGADVPLLEMCRRIRLVAPRRTPVLIHGASGTGKELVARAIHRLSGRDGGHAGHALSPSTARPFRKLWSSLNSSGMRGERLPGR